MWPLAEAGMVWCLWKVEIEATAEAVEALQDSTDPVLQALQVEDLRVEKTLWHQAALAEASLLQVPVSLSGSCVQSPKICSN